MSDIEWQQYFPRDTFRKYQAATIELILKSFASGKKYVIVEGTTGSGKSLLAITVGRYFKNAYLATPQKMLQDQYSADFKELIYELKGRGTYPCLRTNFTMPKKPEEDKKNKKNKKEEPERVLVAGVDYLDVDFKNIPEEYLSLIQYNCANAPCNRGSARKKKLMQTECGDFCVYLNERANAFAHDLTLMNFSNLLLFTRLMHLPIPWLGKRPLLILDEAHLIEDHLYEWASFMVSTRALKGLEMYFDSPQEFLRSDLPFSSVAEICTYLENHVIPACKGLLKMQKGGEGNDDFESLTETSSERKRRIQALYEKVCGFLGLEKEKKDDPQKDVADVEDTPVDVAITTSGRPTEQTHVLVPKTRLDGNSEIPSGTKVVPFDVSSLGPTLAFASSTDKVLLMSATILDVDTYTKSLGIKPEEATFIRVPSTFPAKNRPIIGMQVGFMSYAKIQATLPKVIEQTVNLLEKHSDQKGIIHTGNFTVCRSLEKYLKENGLQHLRERCLFAVAENAKQKAEIIRRHTESDEPTVLVGPGFLEGLDLKDDLARFQIVMKMPYPSLGDPLIKRKSTEFPEWYQLRTALSFIQLTGRPVRSATDWAVTYVLDSCWRSFWEKAKHIFPEHLHQSIEWVKVY